MKQSRLSRLFKIIWKKKKKRKRTNPPAQLLVDHMSQIWCFLVFQKLAHSSDYTSSDFWNFETGEFMAKYCKLKFLTEGWWLLVINISVTAKPKSESKTILLRNTVRYIYRECNLVVLCLYSDILHGTSPWSRTIKDYIAKLSRVQAMMDHRLCTLSRLH